MGCASSKRVESSVAVDVYHPPPTSVSLFDVSTINEPWLITTREGEDEEEEIKKPTHVPVQLLEKLDTYEIAPKSWSEISKALEDLKPTIEAQPVKPAAKSAAKPKKQQEEEKKQAPPVVVELTGFRPVKENSFVLRDRQEREGKESVGWKRRDPLEGYPERCPPGNPDGIVLYTTTLRGVRRTFEDCERARQAVEALAMDAGAAVDERNVSLHGAYLKELRELAGEGASVPRLFVRGRYIGGAEQVLQLAETGRLGGILRLAAAKGRVGPCEGCGGARFVPCLTCNGSCKVVGEDGKGVVRCGECNENGLVLCPICH